MGLYDRDYYREEEPKGFQLGLSQSVTVNLIVINVVLYLVDALLSIGLTNFLALGADLIDRPWNFYQLLTAGFVHSTQPMHIIFNMLALWFFGRDVEVIYGRKEFIQLYLSLIVCASLTWLVCTNLSLREYREEWYKISMVGASGAIAGIIAIFICHYPTRTILLNFFIPIPAWVFGIIWLAGDLQGALLGGRGGPNPVAYTAHLGGAAFGFLFYKTRFQLGRLIPQKFSLPKLGPKPALRVHRPETRSVSLSEQADAVLEKIAASGQDSLTASERRILEEYSRQMQQKHR